MGREALLERIKEVVEKESSAKESAKTFAYEVLPSLLDNLLNDFARFLLSVVDAGYAPVDWTFYSYMNTHFLWLSKGDYDMRIEWVDYDWLKDHPDVNPCPSKPLVTLSLRKCPHIMVKAYYTDVNISEMEKTLEEKLKDPQNAQCRAKDEGEERRREEWEHAREESERFWRTVKESADWEVYHIPF